MDPKKLRSLKLSMIGKDLRERHRMLRVVGGVTRFRILSLLSAAGEPMNVTQIADAIDASVSTISHDLRVLKKDNFVIAAGRGREVYYRTNGLMETLFPLLRR
ncbi:MAG TPA: metalloregulator ArsR/SmtB family transcription factor [Candidatus Baltobacteraceae bacterium]|nr:metalloregulator ArsR/SmtB family transcription factor [Candidatus Baltobacteraceae bacterium]